MLLTILATSERVDSEGGWTWTSSQLYNRGYEMHFSTTNVHHISTSNQHEVTINTMNTQTENEYVVQPTALEILSNANLENSFWGKKVIAAEKRGHFTDSNFQNANSWVTGACGKDETAVTYFPELLDNLPPRDRKVRKLGEEFYEAVRDGASTHYWNREYRLGFIRGAASTLVEMQERLLDIDDAFMLSELERVQAQIADGTYKGEILAH